MNQTLVIGYGNTFRRDDAAGVRAAQLVAERYPAVECVTAPQLTLDMAVALAHYSTVVFFDANVAAKELQVRLLKTRKALNETDSKSLTPQMLLDAARVLYGAVPRRTFHIEIPARDFSVGEDLSPDVLACVQRCATEFSDIVSADRK